MKNKFMWYKLFTFSSLKHFAIIISAIYFSQFFFRGFYIKYLFIVKQTVLFNTLINPILYWIYNFGD